MSFSVKKSTMSSGEQNKSKNVPKSTGHTITKYTLCGAPKTPSILPDGTGLTSTLDLTP